MMECIFSRDLVLFHPTVNSRQELLEEASQLLLSKGYVRDSFADALQEREASFPTGIPLEELHVAIPHADGKHVNRSAVSVCVLPNEIQFGSMADRDDQLGVRIVFVLALQDAKKHLALLQPLMKGLQSTQLTRALVAATDADEVYRLLQSEIFSKISW